MTSTRRPSLTKTLVKHGNSLALVIDRPILDLLGIGEETPLTVSTDGQCLVLTPVKSTEHRARVRASMQKVHTRYAKALKRLAE